MLSEQWRKSARSGSEGNCVEVRRVGDRVEVRNSKRPGEKPSYFTPAEWDAFTLGAKDGEFDL